MWCHDPKVWRFVFARYLPALAVLSTLWEIAQLPLYTLWWEAPPLSIAYAVLHCILGDVLIGVGALLAALIITRSGALRDWCWILVGTVIVTVGLGYTAFSEWFNTTVRPVWTYSEWMPVPLLFQSAYRRFCNGWSYRLLYWHFPAVSHDPVPQHGLL